LIYLTRIIIDDTDAALFIIREYRAIDKGLKKASINEAFKRAVEFMKIDGCQR